MTAMISRRSQSTADTAPRASGFALPSVLWATAIMALIFAGIAERVAQQQQLHRSFIEAADRERAALSVREEILFWFMTGRLSQWGLTLDGDGARQLEGTSLIDLPAPVEAEQINDFRQLPLDGRPRRRGNLTLAVVDLAGLININTVSPDSLNRLLRIYGIDEDRGRLLYDRLQDYIDIDDLVRLDGAEADDYRRNGLLPPTNRSLRSVHELQRISGWMEQPALWRDDSLLQLISTAQAVSFNINTAPPALLGTLLDLTPDQIDTMARTRDIRPFMNLQELVSTIGIAQSLSSYFYRTFPGNRYRVYIWSEGKQGALWTEFELTPLSLVKPYRILETTRGGLPIGPATRIGLAVETAIEQNDAADIPPLPDPALLAASP